MADCFYSATGQQAVNCQEEIVRALAKEMEKNRKSRTEGVNAAGSSCSGPLMNVPTPLLRSLVEWYSSTSQRRKGCYPRPGSSRGLSPSVSSDGSVCGGLNSRDVEVGLPRAAPAMATYGRGRNDIAARGVRPRAVGQEEAAGPTPNSRMQSSALNTRRASEFTTISTAVGCAPKAIGCAPKATGCVPVKVHKKRKRKSKKPLTTIVETTLAEFCSTVQKLTGLRELPGPAVGPQPEAPRPERPQAKAVPVDVDLDSRNPPARSDSSFTSVMTPARPSSPIASDRAPQATFSVHDSAPSVSSSSRSSGLNYCMGYEQALPWFLAEDQQQDYNEDLGQLRDDSHGPPTISVYRSPSKPVEYKKEDGGTHPASSIGGSGQATESLQRSESKGKEGIARENGCSGFGHDVGSNSPISDQFAKPSPFLVVSHRPGEPGEPTGFENDLESDLEWVINPGYRMADSFVNYY